MDLDIPQIQSIKIGNSCTFIPEDKSCKHPCIIKWNDGRSRSDFFSSKIIFEILQTLPPDQMHPNNLHDLFLKHFLCRENTKTRSAVGIKLNKIEAKLDNRIRAIQQNVVTLMTRFEELITGGEE